MHEPTTCHLRFADGQIEDGHLTHGHTASEREEPKLEAPEATGLTTKS